MLAGMDVAAGEPLDFVKTEVAYGTAGADGSLASRVVRVYKDDAGRRLALILLIDPFDANLPSTEWREVPVQGARARVVIIGGTPFSSENELTCFVNGPYGGVVGLALSLDELTDLKNAAGQGGVEFLDAWHSLIEPKYFTLEGKIVDGVRDGTWTYLLDGKPYIRKTYSQGRSSGVVTNYYPNGAVQSERHYLNGLPTGRWTYHTSNGTIAATIDVNLLRMNMEQGSASDRVTLLLSPRDVPQQKTGFVWRLGGPSEFLVAGQRLD
ncbi:MAG: hypothetical protein ABI619_13570 [Betaproteobacteria bacterium]